MRIVMTAALLGTLAASPLLAAEGRVRIENSGSRGVVSVLVSDEDVRTVEISVPGLISGEWMTVEAPASRVRLGGGTLNGDPLLEAAVREKVREESPRGPAVTVLPSPPRFRRESQRYVNEVFTGAGLTLDAAWGLPYWSYAPVSSSRPRCEVRSGRASGARTLPAARPARGSFTARGMMPRR
jgi:hypothetical protein